MKRYIVTLTSDERQALHDLIAAGKAAAQKLAHARILLKADVAPGPGWTDERIAEAVEVSTDTVAIFRNILDAARSIARARRKARRTPTRLVYPRLFGNN